MGVGIDWVSMGLILAAFAVSQVSSISLAARYWVNAAAFAGVAVYRLSSGRAAGLNMVFVLAAAAFAGYYTFRAFQTRKPKADL